MLLLASFAIVCTLLSVLADQAATGVTSEQTRLLLLGGLAIALAMIAIALLLRPRVARRVEPPRDKIDVAVFDNGFFNADSIRFFKKAFNENRIHPMWNFVNKTNKVFNVGGHGTNVLSCMASYIPDTMIGTAPNANYYLFVTEDNASESKLEEVNWAKAAEVADSIGIDVINSSLGYTDFDDVSTNYTYQDMDGKTTIISKAAEMASEKGILVVNSAGNEGEKSWHYISAPSDAKTVLCIGAVNATGILAGFSGRGPSADQRIKPDIVAKGASATVVNVNGEIGLSNGTSFSSPIMAGMAASLWQSNLTSTNLEIREAIIKSTDKLIYPNNNYGYGLPNFKIAYEFLQKQHKMRESGFKLFPLPFKEFINISNDYFLNKTFALEIYNERGNFIRAFNVDQTKNKLGFEAVDLSSLSAGIYFMKIISDGKSISYKIIKEL